MKPSALFVVPFLLLTVLASAQQCQPSWTTTVISSWTGSNAMSSSPSNVVGNTPSTWFSLGDGGRVRVGFGAPFSTSGNSGHDLVVDEYNAVDCYFIRLKPADAFTQNALVAAGLTLFGDVYQVSAAFCGDASIDLDAVLPGHLSGELRFLDLEIVDDLNGGNGAEIVRVRAEAVCVSPGTTVTCAPGYAYVVTDFAPGAGASGDPTKILGATPGTHVILGNHGSITVTFECDFSTSGSPAGDLFIEEVGNNECYYVCVEPADGFTLNALIAAGIPQFGAFFEQPVTYCGNLVLDLDSWLPGYAQGQLRFNRLMILDDGNGGNGAEIPCVRADYVCCNAPPAPARIGNRVWVDVDCDGVQDPDEGNFAGATVTLYDTMGTVVATATTGFGGAYEFTVPAGTYVVGFAANPAKYALTAALVGASGLDSDPDPQTGLTGPISVNAGEIRTDVDAGFCILCTGPAASVNGNLPACGLPMDPVLSSTLPRLGSLWTIDFDSAFSFSPLFIFVSFGPPHPLTIPGSSCNVYLDIANPSNIALVAFDLTDANGDWSVTYPILADPVFAGLDFTLQGRVCAPQFPSPIPGVADWPSNGLHVTLGCD